MLKSNAATRELPFLEQERGGAGARAGPGWTPARAGQSGRAALPLAPPRVAPPLFEKRQFACSIRQPPALPNTTMAPKKADKKPAAKTTKPAAAKKGRKKTKARLARLPPPAHAHSPRRSSPTRSTSTRC